MEKLNGKKTFAATLGLMKVKVIDRYIIRKFLGTFFFSIALILVIAVVFDFAEKVDNYMENEAPAKAIIFDYYFNFIPYFGILFTPLFVFISVIFFTSKMAINNEIIAILNCGMSFKRMMWPYLISATVIAVVAFGLTNFVIPRSNQKMFEFEGQYYRPSVRRITVEHIHRQVFKDVYIFMGSFNPVNMRGQNFTIEKFGEDGKLESKLSAPTVVFDTAINKWSAMNYTLREIKHDEVIISTGRQLDTMLTISPADFSRDPKIVNTMTYSELNNYIEVLQLQGSDELKLFLIEKYRRFANPFATFILTFIGVSLSSRKIRGGIGMSIGIGLMLTFSYILFLQFASQFSLKGNLDPLLAMWIPNIIYIFIAFVLYKLAPK
jgi:lipopolysaccharide export system permease protein